MKARATGLGEQTDQAWPFRIRRGRAISPADQCDYTNDRDFFEGRSDRMPPRQST